MFEFKILLLIFAAIVIGASGALLGLQFLDDCITDYRHWKRSL